MFSDLVAFKIVGLGVMSVLWVDKTEWVEGLFLVETDRVGILLYFWPLVYSISRFFLESSVLKFSKSLCVPTTDLFKTDSF